MQAVRSKTYASAAKKKAPINEITLTATKPAATSSTGV